MNNICTKGSVGQRNYGIDLLRLVAAFYVIVLHTVNQGGIYEACDSLSYQNNLCRLLMIFSICAVNIFGIISGYVGYRDTKSSASLSGYLTLWFSVVFYSVIICAVYMFLLPGYVTVNDLIQMFFPLSKKLYWYFSAYTLVYFLSPHLNRLLQALSDAEQRRCFWIICLVIVPLEYLGKTFGIGQGYSATWLIILYLIGAIIKKCKIGNKIPSLVLILGIFLSNLLYFYLNTRHYTTNIFIFYFNFEIDSSYVSPFYLYPAILYVILFSRFSLKAPIQKLVSFCTPATFFVYIINVQPQFWMYFMNNRYAHWVHLSPSELLIRTIIFSLGFVLIVVLIDYFRRKFFRLLKIPFALQKVSNILQSK